MMRAGSTSQAYGADRAPTAPWFRGHCSTAIRQLQYGDLVPALDHGLHDAGFRQRASKAADGDVDPVFIERIRGRIGRPEVRGRRGELGSREEQPE